MIFGREPAFVAGFIAAALALLTGFGLDLSTEQVVLINAAVTALLGVYVAYVTQQTLLGVVVAATNAILALAIGFGANLGEEQTTAIVALVPFVLGMWQRTQATPLGGGEGNFILSN